MKAIITFTKASLVDMLLSGATHTRLLAKVMALVSVLSGSVDSADLVVQAAEPQTANVLYEAGDFDNWSFTPSTPDWRRLNSVLLNDGTRGGPGFAPIFAPYRPPSADYAVQAEIRVIKNGNSFGVVVRSDGNREGYAVGLGLNLSRPSQLGTNFCYLDGVMSPFIRRDCIEAEAFDPGMDWHTYRVEARGIKITLLIDNQVMLSKEDTRFTSAGKVGLWSSEYQLEVRNFKVIALN